MYKESRFALGDLVKLRLSAEVGEVVGIAFYRNESAVTPIYWVIYVDANGKQRKDWFDELDLL